jgi:predicted O-methyltransferase YrrM
MPTTLHALTTALFAVLAAVAFVKYRKYRRRWRTSEAREVGHPIPTVRIADFHELLAATPRGPTPAATVWFVGAGDGLEAATSDLEAWILAVLAKRATVMFEFGTGTGRTAYLWALNSPAQARVTTLTLAPGQRERYTVGEHDDPETTRVALEQAAFTDFLYAGTPAAAKIEQLFGDSKEFDATPYHARCDLVFVDGSHAYSYIRSDTEKALRMLKPGGILLWHDYRGPWDEKDVYRYLNELRRDYPLVRLNRTSLIAYRAPMV